MRLSHSTVNPYDVWQCAGCGGWWSSDYDRHNTDGETDVEWGDWCLDCCPTCKEETNR